MKFFSNEAKENTEEQAHDDRDDREANDVDDAEHVRSEPVAVPVQRAGSPWSDAPGAADDTVAGTVDDGADAELADRERRDDTPEFHEPGPQPTAFGASTVGGAVAASAVANPQNDTWDATDRDSAANDGVGDDRSVAPGDGVVTDELRRDDSGDRYDGDDLVRSDAASSAPAHAAADTAENTGAHGDQDPVDLALEDHGDFDDPQVRDASGTAYGPDGTVTDTDQNADTSVDANAALKDDGDFDSPTVVEPSTGEPLDASAGGTTADTGSAVAGTDTAAPDTDSATDADAAPVVAAVAGSADAKPGSTASPNLDRLFADGDSFTERFRDIQLRFVDSPKEATADAASLVSEAVDRLTSALKSQKDGLASNSEDTERLRVELRGYRDMLNRLTSL
jgi:hypothetical protein